MEQTSEIIIIPSPGMGHLIPLVELAKRLIILHHPFTITFLVPTDGPPSKAQTTFLDSLPTGMSSVLLPPVNFDDLSPDVKIETRISLTVLRSLPAIRDAVTSILLSKPISTIIVDLFGTHAFDVAIQFSIAPYIFFPSTAMALSLFFHLPKLDEQIPCDEEYRQVPHPIQIPGCVPIFGSDLLDPVQDRKNDAYKYLLFHAKRYGMAEGIMVNSFMELEPGAIKSLQQKQPPVYPVGPLIQMGSSTTSKAANGGLDSLRWLDDQPRGSVLFISFGSGGTLSYDQLNELALGLELSEQRFLWVVRTPNDKVANASYFNSQSHNDPLGFLPKGFLDRTKGNGLVVPDWAPQAQILSHGSTGGFLTHCGWNSILESVVNGVPLIAWPLYAEQKMNAVMLSEDIKVAIRPKMNENGLITLTEIAKVVKGLMEGEQGKALRNRMRDLKDSAAKVVSEDGTSTRALSELASKWKLKF